MRDTVVDTQVIRDAVWLACRAPSLHNSQPWRWVAEGHVVHLFADSDRAPSHTDTTGREMLIGCGAVLDHFRVAMAAAGWTANVDRFPNPNNPRHLASIDFSPLEFVTDGHRRRADAILARHTDRLPFAAPSDWDSLEDELRGTVDADDVRLDVVPDELRPEVAEASQLTESLRLYDSSYHAELIGWTTDLGRDRRHTAELADLGSRKRSRRCRPKLPGDPQSRAAWRGLRGSLQARRAVDQRRHPRQHAAVR